MKPPPDSKVQPRRGRWLIFCGALLIFLAFYKGDGGYHDLVYYLDDAEGLWLRGDMARPGETEEVDLPDGTTAERPVYSQYSLGLAFVSGPFVLLSHGVERLTGGAVSARKLAVLIIPIFGALAALLLYEIGCELDISPRARLWAVIIFIAGTPILTFVRLFYTETAIVFFVLLAIWAFLKTQTAPGDRTRTPSPTRQILWSLLGGAGLALAGACHYAEGPLVATLWLGMTGTLLFGEKVYTPPFRPTFGGRVLNVVALSGAPLLAVATILFVNYLRRGHALDTGYASDVGEIHLSNVFDHNWRYFFWAKETKIKLGLFARDLWIAPGIILLWLGTLHSRSRWLRRALIVGALLQTVFWMCYAMLGFSPVRYLMPAVGALSVALLALGHWIDRWMKTPGLVAAGLVLIAWNLFWFFSGDDRNLSLLRSPDTHEFLMYTWYMQPFTNGLTDGYGTPPGLMQWFLLGALVLCGSLCLTKAALVLSCEDLQD